MTINGAHTRLLLAALKRLRVWESQWDDLSYAPDDPRGAIPDREQPPEYIAERERLERDVVRIAALIGGEMPDAALMFADAPSAPSNPYNLDRVRQAAAIFLGV